MIDDGCTSSVWMTTKLEVSFTNSGSFLLLTSMTTQHNSIGMISGFSALPNTFEAATPLAELANQLSPHEACDIDTQGATKPCKPQVVFVDHQSNTQIIEITIDDDAHIMIEQAESVQMSDDIPDHSPSDFEPHETIDVVEPEQRFAVDPFVYELDGPVPVMPTLPIVEAQELTDRVVARKASGEHHGWRLLPIPYPAEGNRDSASVKNKANSTASEQPQESNKVWTETEVVTESDNSSEDCFYAKPGQVISIDGNQGFDHIDLRSYSIDAATFQPGAILLHSDIDPTELSEGEKTPPPISIRHRGLEFAIFKGEIRVEL